MKKALPLIAAVTFTIPVMAMAQHGHGGGSTAPAEMARCAYSSMPMKQSVMKKATVKGQALWFCTDRHHTEYAKWPERFRQIAKVGALNATVNFLTHSEHMQAMKDMKMEMPKDKKPAGTHHLSVYLNDGKGKMVKPTRVLLRVTSPNGKGVTNTLAWMDTMSHYGGDFDLNAKGKYKIDVMVMHEGKQLQSSIDYTVK